MTKKFNIIEKYINTIKYNKDFFIEIIISLLLFSLFSVVFYYIIYSFFNINESFYKINYMYNKDEKNLKYVYKEVKPRLVYKEKEKEILYFDEKGNIIYKLHNKFDKGFHIYNYYISFNKTKIYIGIKLKKDVYIYKNIFDDIYMFLRIFSILVYVMILGNLIVLIEILNNENKKTLLKLANTESLATNNSMVILTENIHHELNTPLSVIENKYAKLKKEIEKLLINECGARGKTLDDILKYCDNKNVLNFIKTFKDIDYYMDISRSQIEGILDNMRDFKKLRFSNGNKTIYDIIEGSVKILKVTYNSFFESEIDERFKYFRINHKSKMKNSDLINILLNHIKNSLEAESSIIKIYIYKEERKYLNFIIEDDGNGIPKEIMKHIYSENVSSKNLNNSVGLRGNGMFLNKNLLQIFGGDEEVLWSEEGKGTKFLIKIPIVRIEE